MSPPPKNKKVQIPRCIYSVVFSIITARGKDNITPPLPCIQHCIYYIYMIRLWHLHYLKGNCHKWRNAQMTVPSTGGATALRHNIYVFIFRNVRSYNKPVELDEIFCSLWGSKSHSRGLGWITVYIFRIRKSVEFKYAIKFLH